jgi:hypothetical protein
MFKYETIMHSNASKKDCKEIPTLMIYFFEHTEPYFPVSDCSNLLTYGDMFFEELACDN